MEYKIKEQNIYNTASIWGSINKCCNTLYIIKNTRMIPKNKYVVAFGYRSIVGIEDILYSSDIFKTFTEARSYLDSVLSYHQDDSYGIYIMRENYIYDVLHDKTKYIKRDNMWILLTEDREYMFTLKGFDVNKYIDHSKKQIVIYKYDTELVKFVWNRSFKNKIPINKVLNILKEWCE